MKLSIPNEGELELKTVILDLNGTLTVQGNLISGAKEKIQLLKEKDFRVILFSGDTRGTGKNIAENLGIELVKTVDGEEKRKSATELDPTTCVAIGNGLIDKLLFQTVRLSIATVQAEGVHVKTLQEADIIVPTLLNALDLLLDEASLIATLRS